MIHVASTASSFDTTWVTRGAVAFVDAGKETRGMSVNPYGPVVLLDEIAPMRGGPVDSTLTIAFTNLGLISAITSGRFHARKRKRPVERN